MQMRILASLLVCVGATLAFSFANVANAGTEADLNAGFQWLDSELQAGSGLLTSALASDEQATLEAMRALAVDPDNNHEVSDAWQRISGLALDNTESLSRQIATGLAIGEPTSIQSNRLRERFSGGSGGVGEFPGFAATALDTAYGLEGVANNLTADDTRLVQAGLHFLLAQQNQDGGFPVGDGARSGAQESSIYASAVALRALQRYRLTSDLQSEIERVRDYLLTQPIQGGAGSNWLLAEMLLALLPATSDLSQLQPIVDVLSEAQTASGSWENDAYTTALALRALQLVRELPGRPVTGSIGGTVTDAGDGAPLADVTIEFVGPVSGMASSASAGQFLLFDLPPGEYQVSFLRSGYQGLQGTVEVVAGSQTNLGVVELERKADVALLQGVITAATDGSPVAGAVVDVTGDSSASVTAGPDGRYALEVLSGPLEISVSASGFIDLITQAEAVAGETLLFSPGLYRNGETPVADVVLQGVVIDADSGGLLDAVQVSVPEQGTATSTNENGQFSLDGVVAGQFSVAFSRDGYQDALATVTATDGSLVDFGEVPLRRQQTATTSSVLGTVTDSTDGSPIAGANVVVADTGAGAVSDPDGNYRIDGIPQTSFTVTGSAVGFGQQSGAVSQEQHGTVRMDFALTPVEIDGFSVRDVMTPEIMLPAQTGFYAQARLVNEGTTDRQVRIFVKVSDADGAIVDQFPMVDVPLGADPADALIAVAAGSEVPTEVRWNTSIHSPGWYDLTVQAVDGSTGQLLGEGSTPIQIESTRAIRGQANFDPPVTQLLANEPVDVSALIMNGGNQLLENLELRAEIRLRNAGSQQINPSAEVSELLAGGGLNRPTGIARDDHGNVLVANRNAGNVLKIAADGSVSEFAAVSFAQDVNVGADGRIHVVSHSPRRLLTYSATGELLAERGLTFSPQRVESLSDGGFLFANSTQVLRLDASGQVTELIGRGFVNARDAVAMPDGTIFFADFGANAIFRFQDGLLSRYIEIPSPNGLSSDDAGDLYTVSWNEGKLYRISPDGTMTELASGLDGPASVQHLPDGHFLIPSAGRDEILRVATDGSMEVVAPFVTNRPQAVQFTDSGELWVVGSRNLVRINGALNPLERRTVNINASDMAQAGDGRLLLVDHGRLFKQDDSGQFVTLASGFSGASAAAPLGQDWLVADSNRNRIASVSPDGQVEDWLLPAYDTTRSMVNTPDGGMLIASRASAGWVTRVAPDGRISREPGTFQWPRAIALDGQGGYFVAEEFTRRVVHVNSAGATEVLVTLDFRPGGMTRLADGTLVVVQRHGSTLFKVSVNGAVSEWVTLPHTVWTDDLITDASGTVWVSHNSHHKVSRILPDGTIETIATRSLPAGLVPDGLGGVYVAVHEGIQRIGSDATVSDVVFRGALQSRRMIDLALDGDGNLVAFDNGRREFVLSATGELISVFSSITRPRDIVVTQSGRVFVANGDNSIIEVTDTDRFSPLIVDGAFLEMAEATDGSLVAATRSSLFRVDPQAGSAQLLAGGFSNISALDVAAGGTIALGDSNRNEIALVDRDGTIIDRITGIVDPRDALQLPGGKIIVANAFPNRLLQLREDGSAIPFGTETGILALALDQDNERLFATKSSQILELDNAGGRISAVSLSGVRDVIFAGDDTFATASDGLYRRSATDAGFNRIASGIRSVSDMAVDEGRLFVSDSQRGAVFELIDGQTYLAGQGFASASSLNVNGSGKLWVSHGPGSRISLLDPATKAVEETNLGSILPGITDLAVAKGKVFSLHSRENTINRIAIDGSAPEFQPGDLVYQETLPVAVLALDEPARALDFPPFDPPLSGDFELTIQADGGAADGALLNTLHVGGLARGNIALSRDHVFPGDQSVSARLDVFGADNAAVSIIDPDSAILAAASGAQRRGVASDSLGNIYATDHNRLVRITPDGEVSDFVTGVSFGNGLAVDNSDNIYAASGRDVIRISPQGQMTTAATFSSTVTAIAATLDGRIFATGSWRAIDEILPSGETRRFRNLGAVSPAALTIDGFGAFYVLDTRNTILKISPDGEFISVLFDEARFEYEGVNVVADCANNLLFAPFGLEGIKPVGEEDRIVQFVGDTGEVRQIFFGPPVDVALRDIDVLYFDRFNSRLLMWTDRNNGKIFSFPIVCGGLNVDVRVVARDDVALTNAVPGPSEIIERDDGESEYVWNLEQVGNLGQGIDLGLNFVNLAEGEQRPALAEAFLEFSNSFVPEEVLRVPLEIPNLLAESRKTLGAATDRLRYAPDETVFITLTAGNEADRPFDGTITTQIVDAGGTVVDDFESIPVADLAGLASADFGLEWSPAAVLAGDYRVVATMFDEADREVADADAVFAIDVGGQAQVAEAFIGTDQALYRIFDTVALTGRVTNRADNALLDDASYRITVSAPDGTVIFDESGSLPQLAPGAMYEQEFNLGLADAEPGEYLSRIEVIETATDLILDQAQAGFTVELTAEQQLAGVVTVEPAQISAGESTECEFTATNRSSLPADAVLLTRLLDTGEGKLLDEQLHTVRIEAGATWSFGTFHRADSLGLGAFACALSVRTNSGEAPLDDAPFQVIEPPFNGQAEVVLEQQVQAPSAVVWFQAGEFAAAGGILTDALAAAGIEVAIVDSAISFGSELRSGRHQLYGLVGDALSLEDQDRRLLREAVHRGEGLIVAGGRPDLPRALADALGLVPAAELRQIQAFSLRTGDAAGEPVETPLEPLLPARRTDVLDALQPAVFGYRATEADFGIEQGDDGSLIDGGGPGPIALWADGVDAPGALQWAGGRNEVRGLVHSNGDIRLSGAQNRLQGPVRYAGELVDQGSQNQLDIEPARVAPQVLPIGPDPAEFVPGGPVALALGEQFFDASDECAARGRFQRKPNQMPLPDGVYWVPCDVVLNGADPGGMVTIVSTGKIQVSGSRANFEPFYEDIQFVSTRADAPAIALSAGNSTLGGLLYAPFGEVKVSGSGWTFGCAVVGRTIRLNGANAVVDPRQCNAARPVVETPAVAAHRFGDGLAVYAAFDWPGAIQTHDDDDAMPFGGLLADQIVDLAQLSRALRSGARVPLRASVLNQGDAFQGQLRLRAVGDARVVFPGLPEWLLDLAGDGGFEAESVVELGSGTSTSIEAAVSVDAPVIVDELARAELAIAHLAGESVAVIIADLEGLQDRDPALDETLALLRHAETVQASGDIAATLEALLDAAEAAGNSTRAEAAAIRTRIDWLIWRVARG